ncbi:MAG: hypothetical protein HRT88_00195 [Lentisphaeraceae bacterium]|nr:hypothetical protein [Lentisphaeraceae bacterium]
MQDKIKTHKEEDHALCKENKLNPRDLYIQKLGGLKKVRQLIESWVDGKDGAKGIGREYAYQLLDVGQSTFWRWLNKDQHPPSKLLLKFIQQSDQNAALQKENSELRKELIKLKKRDSK